MRVIPVRARHCRLPAVIGYNKSCTIAKPGIKAKDEHIAKMIAEGKVAFGLSVEHVEHAIPMLINHLK